VESAEALYGEDGTGVKKLHGLLDRHGEPGTAIRAGDRLGVIAAVGRVLVLGVTRRAHLEALHRRVLPVVRRMAHDRQARAALCAVDEWVAVAAVVGVEELGQAPIAGGDIGRDRGSGCLPAALLDPEKRFAHNWDSLGGEHADPCERRRVVAERARELVEAHRFPLDLDDDPPAVIEDVPAKIQPRCEAVHERPEPDALDYPGDPKAAPLDRAWRR
jgi:hypothetical protein